MAGELISLLVGQLDDRIAREGNRVQGLGNATIIHISFAHCFRPRSICFLISNVHKYDLLAEPVDEVYRINSSAD
jgi:hypothetical protein